MRVLVMSMTWWGGDRFRALGGSIGAIDDFLLEAVCKHIAPGARSVRLHDASGTITDGAAQFLLRCLDLRELHVDGIWSDEIAVCLQQVSGSLASSERWRSTFPCCHCAVMDGWSCGTGMPSSSQDGSVCA